LGTLNRLSPKSIDLFKPCFKFPLNRHRDFQTKRFDRFQEQFADRPVDIAPGYLLTHFVPIAASGQTAHVIGIELAPSLMILNAHPTPALAADNDALD
jgi:hypothetical protein